MRAAPSLSVRARCLDREVIGPHVWGCYGSRANGYSGLTVVSFASYVTVTVYVRLVSTPSDTTYMTDLEKSFFVLPLT